MEIRIGNPLPPGLLPTSASAPKNPIAALQPGQPLLATVESRLADNQFLLKLADGSQTLRAESALALQIGQTLRLEVIKAGDMPLLKIVAEMADAEPGMVAMQQALRQFLPKLSHQPAELASALRTLLTANTASAERALPEGVRSAIQSALDSLPQRLTLTKPEGVKQTLMNSGLFYEAKLASAPADSDLSAVTDDLKGKLMQLVERLQKQIPVASPVTTLYPPAGATKLAPEIAATGTPPLPEPADAEHAQPETADRGQETKPAEQKGEGVKIATSELKEALITRPSPLSSPASKTPMEATSTTAGPMSQETGKTMETDRSGSPVTVKRDSDFAPTPPLAEKPEAEKPTHPAPAADAAATDLKSLLHKTEGTLARLVLDQLASQPQPPSDNKQATHWQMEIPFRDGNPNESAKFKITREQRVGESVEQAWWTVVLELSPPNLGTIHSRISFNWGRIDTRLWSDQDSTVALMEEHLELLTARLQQAGLEVGQVQTLPEGPTGGSKDITVTTSPLVDERA